MYSERTDSDSGSDPTMLQQPGTEVEGYLQLDLVRPALLGVVLLLGLGCDWGRKLARVASSVVILRHGRNGAGHIARVSVRGVCARGMRSHEVRFIEVGGSLNPTDVLHVGQPEVLSGLRSPDSEANESDHISENYKGFKSARPTK